MHEEEAMKQQQKKKKRIRQKCYEENNFDQLNSQDSSYMLRYYENRKPKPSNKFLPNSIYKIVHSMCITAMKSFKKWSLIDIE